MDDPFAKIVEESQSDPFKAIVEQSAKQPPKRGYMEEATRQIDLLSKNIHRTALSLPTLAAEGLAGVSNKLFGTNMQPEQAIENTMDKWIGTAKEETPVERVVGDTTRATLAMPAMAATAAHAASVAKRPVTKKVMEMLAANPEAQVIPAAMAAAGSGTAREAGYGPTGQMAAGMVAPMVPFLAVQGARGVSAIPRKLTNIVDAAGMPGGGKRAAGAIIVDALGEGRKPATAEEARKMAQNIDEVAGYLKNAPETQSNWTAPQIVASKSNNPAFVAINAIAKNDRPKQYAATEAKQKAAEIAALAKMARGGTAEESLAAQQLMRKNLEEALGPQREIELRAAGQAGETLSRLEPKLAQKQGSYVSALQNRGVMQTEAAQQGQLAQGQRAADGQLIRNLPEGNAVRQPSIQQVEGAPVGAFPVPGQPRVPPRYTNNATRAGEFKSAATDMEAIAKQRLSEKQFIENQIGSLEAHGLKPLSVDSVIGNIEAKLASKTTQVNDVMSNALKSIADKFRIAGQGNNVDPYALYEIRKTSINQVFEELVTSGKLNKEQAAAAIKQLRPMIDDAIESAGGTGWKTYITKYHKGLEAVDRVKLLDQAQQMYKNNPNEFVALVRGEKPEVVKDLLAGKYKISDGVPPQRLRQLEAIAERFEADNLVKEATERGASKLTEVLKAKQNPSNATQGLLMREVTLTNNILRILEGKGTKRIDAVLSDLMLPENRAALIEILMKSKPNTKGLMLKEMAKKGINIPPQMAGILMTMEPENANP